MYVTIAGFVQHRHRGLRQAARRGGRGPAAAAGEGERHRARRLFVQQRHQRAGSQLPLAGM